MTLSWEFLLKLIFGLFFMFFAFPAFIHLCVYSFLNAKYDAKLRFLGKLNKGEFVNGKEE